MELQDPLTQRMLEFIEASGMSKSEFADAIGLNRSILSHILSGRNKPSLAIVEKMAMTFESLDLYWLLLGTQRESRIALPPPDPQEMATSKDQPSVQAPLLKPESEATFSSETLLVLHTDGTYLRYTPRKN